LLVVGFIKHVEKPTWLLFIVVMPKKNGKLIICVDYKWFNVATKKDPYSLSFTNEVIIIIARREVYPFLNGLLGYHQIKL
jgi:hypothetical protein